MSIIRNQSSCIGFHVFPSLPRISSAAAWSGVRLVAVVLTVAALAACTHSSGVVPASLSASRHAPSDYPVRRAFVVNKRHFVVTTKKHAPFTGDKQTAEAQGASYGLASFYDESSQTASGEKFNARELTAAHRTLPFGTRLRITNVASGNSVTVRVNDRGPFVPGRIVDLSSSAADVIGMTKRGVAKVKVDIVQ
jgi:rare lipoprotein A